MFCSLQFRLGFSLCEALADALKCNRSVTHIDLGSNGIRDEGAKAGAVQVFLQLATSTPLFPSEALADALKCNRTVTHIDLGYNFIRDEGAKARWCPRRGLCSLQLRPFSSERHSQML